MATIPPAKRPRTDSASMDSSPPNTISRSDIWYPDSNVVLEADGRMQFRVHKSILARESSVFKGMFESPNVSGAMDVEGCPVIPLCDDPEDVTHLLHAIYTASRHFDLSRQLPFAVISALVRLGDKYDIREFYEKAVAHILKSYPNTFREYMDEDTELERAMLFPQYAPAVLRTALIVDLRCALPILYLCSYPYSLEDRQSDLDISVSGPHPCKLADLSDRDKLICIEGYHKGRSMSTELYWNWVASYDSDPPAGCGNPQSCGDAAYRMFHEIHTDALDPSGFHAVLARWEAQSLGDLCSSCNDSYEKFVSEMQRKVWNALPSFYGFSSWEDLGVQQEAWIARVR